MEILKAYITELLTKHPELRDNQNKLVTTVWDKWFANSAVSTSIFWDYYEKGEIPTESTILRLWRLIQMENIDLRGKLWNKRHGKADIICHEIVRGNLTTLLNG